MNWPTDNKRARVPTTRWPNPMPVAFYDLADFGEPGNPPFAIETKTADVMHRSYHHRLQVHGGANDRFLPWSDLDPAKAPGADNRNSLCMSAVDASDLPEGRLAKAHVLQILGSNALPFFGHRTPLRVEATERIILGRGRSRSQLGAVGHS